MTVLPEGDGSSHGGLPSSVLRGEGDRVDVVVAGHSIGLESCGVGRCAVRCHVTIKDG